MRKAQLLTMDFILSIAVFISVLLTIITIWHTVDTQIKDLESRRDMQSLSVAISDSLVRSPGNPEDWNETNVQSIGLASTERILSLGKIHRLMAIGYQQAKSRMRLGALSYQSPEKTYDFYFSFTDKDGHNITTGIARGPIAYYARDPSNTRLLNELNTSGMLWDIHWGNTPATLPNGDGTLPCRGYTCTDFYNHVQPDVAFNRMVGNQSKYRTIVIENLDPVGFGNSDLNITGLQEFVSRGGILVVIGQGSPGANVIDEDFSVAGEYNAGGWGAGNATGPWYIMPYSSEGETVTFAESRWVLRSENTDMRTIVSLEDQPGACMVCFWQYGYGRIYYFESLDGSTEGGMQLIDNTDADALAIIGQPLKFGLSVWNPAQVIITKRTVLIDGIDRELGSMNMYVWVENR